MSTSPLITRLRLLTSLTNDDLRVLEQACLPPHSFAARADIAPEGGRPESVHIVLEGWAARYRLLPGGQRQFPALLLPGDLCDLDGLLLRRVHFGVCALTPCSVAALPHARLRALMERRPAIRETFWWLMAVENAISAECSVGLGRRSALERVAHCLCELLLRLWTVGQTTDNGYALPLTQADLADALGLSGVHVNRTLMELRGRGLITLDDRWLKIHDSEALKRIGAFSADYLHVEGVRAKSDPVSHL